MLPAFVFLAPVVLKKNLSLLKAARTLPGYSLALNLIRNGFHTLNILLIFQLRGVRIGFVIVGQVGQTESTGVSVYISFAEACAVVAVLVTVAVYECFADFPEFCPIPTL